MRILFSALICSSVFFIGCGGDAGSQGQANSDSKPAAPRPPVSSKLNTESTQAVMSLMSKYYVLKNALVATKADEAEAAANQLAADAAGTLNTLQKDSANFVAIKPFMDSIISQSKSLNGVKDANCEKQRVVFEVISRNFYALLKNTETKNAGVYHAFCPMAFNDKGAYWLSEESEIKNPYFGKKMMECGEVTDSF